MRGAGRLLLNGTPKGKKHVGGQGALRPEPQHHKLPGGAKRALWQELLCAEACCRAPRWDRGQENLRKGRDQLCHTAEIGQEMENKLR